MSTADLNTYAVYVTGHTEGLSWTRKHVVEAVDVESALHKAVPSYHEGLFEADVVVWDLVLTHRLTAPAPQTVFVPHG